MGKQLFFCKIKTLEKENIAITSIRVENDQTISKIKKYSLRNDFFAERTICLHKLDVWKQMTMMASYIDMFYMLNQQNLKDKNQDQLE